MGLELHPLIANLFAQRGESLQLFRRVWTFIESLGPVELIPRRTQVGFKRSKMFAWVWLPQMWIKKRPAGSITLAFALGRRVRDPRIEESVEPYAGRIVHHMVISRASDFDGAVKGWLREAYAHSAEGGPSHRTRGENPSSRQTRDRLTR